MFSSPIYTKKDIRNLALLVETGGISIKDGSGIIGEFEHNFASYHGRKYALATNSGTAALHSAFFALGLNKGNEVIIPAFGWHADVTPLLSLGLKPVFCNIDKKTFNLDPDDLVRRVNKRTRALLVVHLFGHPAEMYGIMRIAREKKLKVVEDCSHSFGATYRNRKVGTFGDISCFSLQKSKAVSAGEGGVLMTDDFEYYERSIILGHPGRKLSEKMRVYRGLSLGFKYRPHPLAIALANAHLKRLDKLNSMRKRVWDYMMKSLGDIEQIELPHTSAYCRRGGYYGYRVKYKAGMMSISKDEFLKELSRSTWLIHDENYFLLYAIPFTGSKAFSFHDINSSLITDDIDPDEYSRTTEVVKSLFVIEFPRTLSRSSKSILDHGITVLRKAIEKYRK